MLVELTKKLGFHTEVKEDCVNVICSGGIGDQLRAYYQLHQEHPDKIIKISVSKDRGNACIGNSCITHKWETPFTRSKFVQELPLLFPNLKFAEPSLKTTSLIDNTDKIDQIPRYIRENICPVDNLPKNFVFINLDCSNRFNKEHNPNPWLYTRKYSLEEELCIQHYVKELGYDVVSSLDRYFNILELPYVLEKAAYVLLVDSFCSVFSLGLEESHRNKIRIINKGAENSSPVLNATLSLYKKFGIESVYEFTNNFEKLNIKKCS